MKEFLDKLKNSWLTLAEFGIFICGVVTILLKSPPIDSFNDNTIRFLIIIIIAFLLIPLFLFKQKKHFKIWLFSALLAFVLSGIVLIYYNMFVAKYVIEYNNHKIVIGKRFDTLAINNIKRLSKEENESFMDGSEEHNRTLLSYKGGNASGIWDYNSINQNKIILTTAFYLSIAFLTILILSLIQTLQIVFIKEETPQIDELKDMHIKM